VLSECYGCSQTLRRLGFPSDNIYIQFGVYAADGPFAGRKTVAVCLRWDDKEFNYYTGPVRDDEKFAVKWSNFLERANRGFVSKARLQAMLFQSFAYNHKQELIAALQKKGINPPSVA